MSDGSYRSGAEDTRPGTAPPTGVGDARALERLEQRLGIAGRVARAFLDSKLTPLLVVASLLLGAFAVMVTPREEEPQIQVPMIDVFVALPGADAAEVEERLVVPLEKALSEIPAVEHVYSTAQPSGGMLIVRFEVGTDPDRAALRVHAKLAERADLLPAGTSAPKVVPRGIDDVPVAAWSVWSETLPLDAIRTVANEVAAELARHPRVAQVTVTGSGRRAVSVRIDRERLAAHGLSILQVHQALTGLDWKLPAGSFAAADVETEVEVGGLFETVDEIARAPIAAGGGGIVRVGDIATVVDGPDEPAEYVWIQSGAAGGEKRLPAGLDAPAVTVSVAKKPGTNAVDLIRELDGRLDRLRGPVIPEGVELTEVRDYGFTANEKASELMKHLALATFSVVLLMAFALGRREAVVVLVAVPVTLALTLASSYLFGYTLNRVTLFALIFAIGILVDDAIVVVENVHRHYQLAWTDPRRATIFATDEVGNPTILATFAVIAALLPLAFVSGLMGPYMRPIPINASAAMLFSLAVAFVVSPWLTYRLFRKHAAELAEHPAGGRSFGADAETAGESRMETLYRRLFAPLLASRAKRWALLGGIALLLLAAVALFPLRLATVKMLPHDDKSEVQVVIDLPEGTTLEATAAAARDLAAAITPLPEVTDVEIYAGASAPFNFNGLVRHYFLRSGPVVADLQVNLLPKHDRSVSSHPFAKSLRERLAPIAARHGANVKVAEVPPGPPVLSTLVAEIYAPTEAERLRLAGEVRKILESTPGVVDVDWYVEAPGPKVDLAVDREKAARAGISPEVVARTVRVALAGAPAARLHDGRAREPVPVVLRLPRGQRSGADELLALDLHGGDGRLVPLSEIATASMAERAPFRYMKNLRPVTYVIGEVAGAAESPIYALLDMGERIEAVSGTSGAAVEILFSGAPADSSRAAVKWDGEWQITYEVFRDMGIAFAVVMVLIYLLVVGWFRSFVTPLVIMAPIPLTLIGIVPAHALSGAFFTATSMIGFIALSGIIVRNSILLVDFIHLELAAGVPLETAVIRAAAVRFRPIALTAAALVVGGAVILLDPIFQGLAVALIAGVVVSTALTLIVIPLVYSMYLSTVGVDTVLGAGSTRPAHDQETS